jgi:hypothetical protein
MSEFLVHTVPGSPFARSVLAGLEWFRTDYSGCTVARDELESHRRRVLRMLDRLCGSEPSLRIWARSRSSVRESAARSSTKADPSSGIARTWPAMAPARWGRNSSGSFAPPVTRLRRH